jgi:hypothetical protein
MWYEYLLLPPNTHQLWGRCGRDCMVVGFTTTYVISAFIKFEYRPGKVNLNFAVIRMYDIGENQRIVNYIKILRRPFLQWKLTLNWTGVFGGKYPLWSWLYGCWIYNYLRNQRLYKVRIPTRQGVLDTTLCDKVTLVQEATIVNLLQSQISFEQFHILKGINSRTTNSLFSPTWTLQW